MTDGRHRLLAWTALALVAAWLLRPLLSPAHVEGFSASIVSLGLHIAHGDVGSYDLLHPANLEFFGLSRLGTSLAVAGFVSLGGMSGNAAMLATTWLGVALLAASTFVLVRRWTGADPLLIAAAMLLVPGIAEGAFFFNDNVLSAGLGVTALAIVVCTSGAGQAAIAGLLFGYAVLARTDAVLLAPAIALAMMERDGLRRRTWLRGTTFALVALVPYVAVLTMFGATPFGVLHISRYVVALWDHGPQLWKQRRELLTFVGVPAALLALVGTGALVQRRDWWRAAMLVGMPLVFNLVYFGKLYESRQALPLAPFIAALAVVGWSWLTAEARPPRVALVARLAVAALIVGVLAGPVTVRMIDDGPRVRTGRLQGILYWTHWQAATTRNMAATRSFVLAAGEPATAAILTDAWNSDRYLHLALQDAGYSVVAANDLAPACARTAELFQRGAQRVLHVRIHEPLLPSDEKLRPERFDRYVAPCLAAAHPAHLYFYGLTYEFDQLFGASITTDWLDQERWTFVHTAYIPSVGVMIDSAHVARLRASYGVLALQSQKAADMRGKRLVDLATAERQLSQQVSFR